VLRVNLYSHALKFNPQELPANAPLLTMTITVTDDDDKTITVENLGLAFLGPPAPTQLKLSDSQIDRLTITWSDPDQQDLLSVIEYKIICKSTWDDQIAAIYSSNAESNNTKVIEGLAANTDYTVVVISFTNDVRVNSDESFPASRPTGKIVFLAAQHS